MARTKIKLNGDPKNDLELLLKECSNNNQICYHLKKHKPLVLYLKQETGLDKEPMVLLYHYKENIKDVPKCICGKERQYHCYGYRPTCSRKKCQNIVREESKKKFCLEKYGVEFVTQLETMKEKSKQTCLDKFGVDNCTKSPEIIKKRKQNNYLKYGVEETIILPEIRRKNFTESENGLKRIQKRLPEGYQCEFVYKTDNKKSWYYRITCKKGHTFDIIKGIFSSRLKDNTEICNQCCEYKGSKGEQEVFEYIQSFYKGNIQRTNRKIIKPYEIDIVLDDIKLCIEFNGDYWHSTKINDDKFYHVKKLQKCISIGYDLIQIRENEWNTNKDNIKRKLFNKISDIYDRSDIHVEDDLLIFDLSWYDSRVIYGLEDFLIEELDPEIIKSGQYYQWDCGKFIFKIK